jgi:hypothetical protein
MVPQNAMLLLSTPSYRIIQEAWSNIRRHARAAHVEVTFRYAPDGLAVRIVDDGIGFTPSREDATPDGQWGVRGMRERAELTGGQIELASVPGQGTALTVRIPYPGVVGRDPVCGMRVGPDALSAEHAGVLYRNCSLRRYSPCFGRYRHQISTGPTRSAPRSS